MSRKKRGGDIPWSALVLVAALLWTAYKVSTDPAWGLWIVNNCGWLCQ